VEIMEENEVESTSCELANDDWRVWIFFIGLFIVFAICYLRFARLLSAVDPDVGVFYYFWHDGRIIPGYLIGYLATMVVHKVVKQIPDGREELRTWLAKRRLRL